jgi:hypothetical protein
VAVAQALVPLQELTLKHLPLSPADTVLIGAMENMAAAAAAKATPEIFLAVFIYSTLRFKKLTCCMGIFYTCIRRLRERGFKISSKIFELSNN